jgi:methionyl-tRNA formyltransferase
MGENITGNTTMRIDEGLDTGPILLQQAMGIDPEETATDLFEELAIGGAPLVVQTLAALEKGSIEPRPQDHARATLAPLLTREDGRMDFAARTALELKNRWRGFQPWPGAFTSVEGKKLIVHRMRVAESTADASFDLPPGAEPGAIVVIGERMFVACAQDTWLELIEVQLEGKKRMPARDFLRGFTHITGVRLG